MQLAQDFRFTTHQLLLALDASTVEMMKLVAASAMGTPEWKAASRLQQASFAALQIHLGKPEAEVLMVMTQIGTHRR
jgi:hypothetical protein